MAIDMSMKKNIQFVPGYETLYSDKIKLLAMAFQSCLVTTTTVLYRKWPYTKAILFTHLSIPGHQDALRPSIVTVKGPPGG